MDEKIPEEFKKVAKDFYRDILTTFPECKEKLGQSEINFLTNDGDAMILFSYCKKVYPERFFDILYQNNEIFEDEDINTKFLPNIEFKNLWKEDISDKTRDVIWKYLQLILFSVSKGLEDGESFGDTAKLFEAINEDDLKNKLEETMKEMNNMFNDASNNMFEGLSGETFDMSGINMEDMPNPEEMQDHINGLLGGKLGRLAHEIAEETAKTVASEDRRASISGWWFNFQAGIDRRNDLFGFAAMATLGTGKLNLTLAQSQFTESVTGEFSKAYLNSNPTGEIGIKLNPYAVRKIWLLKRLSQIEDFYFTINCC